MSKKIFSFRFDEELMAQVDAAGGGERGARQAFVTAAIKEKLGGGAAPVAEALSDPEVRVVEERDLTDDQEELLGLLAVGACTARHAAGELDWVEMRVSRVADSLSRRSLLRFDQGLMIAN